MFDYSETERARLYSGVSPALSAYRLAHTRGVEAEVAAMAALYCPEKAPLLRAAAILHDSAKELTDAEQLAVFAAHGVRLREDEAASPKIWHGIAAALLIPEKYPEVASEELLSAVRRHTTGRAGMTLSEALLYLADLTEPGRNFPECAALRAAFWGKEPEKMPRAARLSHLRDVLLLSLRTTRERLLAKHLPVCRDSLEAEAWLSRNEHPFERNENG